MRLLIGRLFVVAIVVADRNEVVTRVGQEHAQSNALSLKIRDDEQAVAVVEMLKESSHFPAATCGVAKQERAMVTGSADRVCLETNANRTKIYGHINACLARKSIAIDAGERGGAIICFHH